MFCLQKKINFIPKFDFTFYIIIVSFFNFILYIYFLLQVDIQMDWHGHVDPGGLEVKPLPHPNDFTYIQCLSSESLAVAEKSQLYGYL